MSRILQGRSVLSSYSVCDKMAVGSESKKNKNKKKQGHKDFWKKRSFELSGKIGSMLLNVGAGCGSVSDTLKKNTNLVARSLLTCHTECLAAEVYLKSSQ